MTIKSGEIPTVFICNGDGLELMRFEPDGQIHHRGEVKMYDPELSIVMRRFVEDIRRQKEDFVFENSRLKERIEELEMMARDSQERSE